MGMVGNALTRLSQVLGNLNFVGTGNRITGDFSNATVANRVMFQTSTVNGISTVGVVPNGTSQTAILGAYNNSDPTNSSLTAIVASSLDCRFSSGITGTGTYLPMTFYTGGAERMRIDTSGRVGIGVAPNANWSTSYRVVDMEGGGSLFGNIAAGTVALSQNRYVDGVGGKYASAGYATFISQGNGSGGVINLVTCPSGAANAAIGASSAQFTVGQTDCVMATANGGLGYGTGAGGTVTQATSKATTVTLSKPTGQITTAADALAAGASVLFQLINSLISAVDTVSLSVTSVTNNYVAALVRTGAGVAIIRLTNISGGPLSEAITIQFNLHKGATS